MPSLFIGLGPNGDVTEDALKKKLEETIRVAGPVRMRGSCAFCDVETYEDGDKAIKELNGSYIETSRLSVQWSKEKRRGDDRRDDRRGGGGGGGRDRYDDRRGGGRYDDRDRRDNRYDDRRGDDRRDSRRDERGPDRRDDRGPDRRTDRDEFRRDSRNERTGDFEKRERSHDRRDVGKKRSRTPPAARRSPSASSRASSR